MWGCCNDNTAKATRDFWPPLRVPMSWRLKDQIVQLLWSPSASIKTHPVMPLIWKFPKCPRYSCSVFPGNLEARNCTGVIVEIKVSTWCWEKYPLKQDIQTWASVVHWTSNSHAKAPITVDMSRHGSQLSRQNLNPEERHSTTKQTNISTQMATYSVDLPAPLAPTIAILESRPTSILTPLRMSLSGVYPNVTSDICSRGGEILSVSGNLRNFGKALSKEVGKIKILELFGFLLFRRFQVRKLCVAPLSLWRIFK